METTNTNTRGQVAMTIAKQLGNATLCMIGAKNLGFTENSLQFKIGRNSKGVTHVIIKLNSLDLYDIEFVRIGRAPNYTRTVIATCNGYYADMMHQAIETHTGLYTKF
jgi:hypothetical protein